MVTQLITQATGNRQDLRIKIFQAALTACLILIDGTVTAPVSCFPDVRLADPRLAVCLVGSRRTQRWLMSSGEYGINLTTDRFSERGAELSRFGGSPDAAESKARAHLRGPVAEKRRPAVLSTDEPD